jgi:hypothetical protein
MLSNMKAISMQTELIGNLGRGGIGPQAVRPAPAWLPAPPLRPARAIERHHPGPSRSFWFAHTGEPLGQKLVAAVLILAGAVGVAYCFASLVDKVEHWALFHSLAAQLIQ